MVWQSTLDKCSQLVSQ